MKRQLVIFVSTLLLSAAPAFAAGSPEAINYQGVLRAADGTPNSGIHDMVFRFHDASSGGNEILTDAHTVGGSGGVIVADGLFNVLLGTGVVSDGASPGTYTSLAALFGGFEDIWLQIEIDAEVLSPRVRVAATPYAQNAERISGLTSSQLLRSDASGSIAGDLSVAGILNATQVTSEELALNGNDLTLNANGPAGDSNIFFYDSGSPTARYLRWDHGETRFAFSSVVTAPDFYSDDDIFLNVDGPDGNSYINFYKGGNLIAERFFWNDSLSRFELTDDLKVTGELELAHARTGFAASGFSLVASDDELAYFGARASGESQLNTYLALIPGGAAQLLAKTDVQLFGDQPGVGTRLMAGFDTDQIDFYIDGSSAARISSTENFIVFGSNLLIGRNGPDRDQDLEFYDSGIAEGERLQWDDSEDRFEFSDDFFVFGDSGASGVKNFVQNHPEDPTLEIVYTSLEGNEATTFTRGTARLQAGVAKIPIEASFAMVTNPDLGLSVHLTPRGSFAQLYVSSISTGMLEVRSDGREEVVFDYIVYGLRIGFEDFPVFRTKMAESHIPPAGHHDRYYSERPELRRHSALERYREIEQNVYGRTVEAMPHAQELREAIGERVPGFDLGAGETVAKIDRPDEASPEQQSIETTAFSQPEIAKGVEDATSRQANEERRAGDSKAATSRTVSDDVSARSFRPSASDLASMHLSDQTLQPGDVVVLNVTGDGSVLLSKFAAEPTVFGVVASDPGLVLGAEGDGSQVAIATSGVVACKVDASYGAIRPGDLLVTSTNPGHAMRAENPLQGTILGKAVGALEHGTGTISIIVTLR